MNDKNDGLVAKSVRLSPEEWVALRRYSAEAMLRENKAISVAEAIRRGVRLLTQPTDERVLV